MKSRKVLSVDAEYELQLIGSHLRTARVRRRMSLAELADRASVAASTLHRLERGDPTVGVGTVLQVMSVFGLLEGINQWIAPESDHQQTLREAQRIRLDKRKPARPFRDDELDF